MLELKEVYGNINNGYNDAVRRDPKILIRVSRILNKEGLHFANLFYIFEEKLTL